MPSAAPTLPGNAGGDARVNYLLDPLQGSLTIGAVKPFGDIQALTPKETCYDMRCDLQVTNFNLTTMCTHT